MNKILLGIIFLCFIGIIAEVIFIQTPEEEGNPASLEHIDIVTSKTTEQVKTKPSKSFNAKTFMLDNGLDIVVIENHRAPVVTHMLWYKVGAADEPKGKSGIAHFLEHLLFKGHSHPKLGTYGPGEFSRIVRAIGGQDNAFTSQDYTAFYQSVAKEHLEKMMKIEAARLRGLDVPQADVNSENKVIQEERRQRTDSNPRAQLREQMNKALFPVHPYGIPVIGPMDEIQGLTWTDAKNFYDKYYVPNNAILVVSGDVEPSQVLEMARRTYGLLEAGDELPPRKRAEKTPLEAHPAITLEHENVKEPSFTRKYRVASYKQDAETSLAMQLLEEIIGANSTSRLYKSLVIEQKLATNISLYYSNAAWDDAIISINATPSSMENIDAMKQAIDKELRLLINDGVTDQELADAKSRLQDEAIFARDSLDGPANIFGRYLVTGSSIDDIEYWPYKVDAITKEQVQEAAKTYLNPDAPSITPPIEGLLLPKAPTEPKGDDK